MEYNSNNDHEINDRPDNNSLKIKPNGAFYLIPIGLLFTGVIIAIVLFVQALSPIFNIEEFTINQVMTVNMVEGSFVSLYIEDTDLTDYDFEEDTEYSTLVYETTSDIYIFQIDVVQTTGDDPDSGFEYAGFNSHDTYTIDQYSNYADIEFTEDGTYEITIASYDDIQVGLGYSIGNYGVIGLKTVFSAIALFLGLGGSIIAFVIIIVLRSKSKAQISQILTEENSDLQTSFIAKEDKSPDKYDF